MVGPLVFLALALMRMDQRRVVVLVHVVARAMLELAEHAARVVMSHVIVVVGMNDSGMRMLMLLVASDVLARACLLQRRPPLLAGHAWNRASRPVNGTRIVGQTREVDEALPSMIGSPSEGGVYERTGEREDDRPVYRWRELTGGQAEVLAGGPVLDDRG